MRDEGKPTKGGVKEFLRILSVNVIGGAVWAILMAYIQPINADIEHRPGNIVLLLLAGAVVGGIFSIGGFLIPSIKRGKRLKTFLYDILYGLASIYTTVALVFLLTMLVLAVSGGSLPIKGNSGVMTFLYLRDLVNALSPDYLVELGLIPVIGSPIVTLLDLVRTRLWRALKPKANPTQKLRGKTLN